jgi:hypothetical protein
MIASLKTGTSSGRREDEAVFDHRLVDVATAGVLDVDRDGGPAGEVRP